MLAVRALARRRALLLHVRTNATTSTSGANITASAPPPPPSPSNSAPKPSKTSSVPRPIKYSTGSSKTGTVLSTTNKVEEGQGKVAERTRRRRRVLVKRRAPISISQPRKWNPPIKPGILPVYDEALKLIIEDSKRLKKELVDVNVRVGEVEKELSSLSVEGKEEERESLEKGLEGLKKKARILEIQSEINLPSVRWSAANGMADLTKPVHGHLIEQKWRSYGTLDLLMERIHQMNVVPDLLPSLHPSFDLRLSFPQPPPLSVYLRTRTKRKYEPVEPGVFLFPEQTRRAPRLYTSVFHEDTRYYTLVLVDADVPDPENEGFTTYLHWMHANIPLSASSCGELLPLGPQTRYVPPHPQRGSPYHRYCLFLLPHVKAGEKISVPVSGDGERTGFDLRTFCRQYGVDWSGGGAAHVWREKWDETVSEIYKHTLKQAEPRYGLPPRSDPYAEVKASKRFIK